MNPWDERFAGEGFAYGTEPSRWLAEQAHRIPPGLPVLALGEGEGRPAVFLAGRGLEAFTPRQLSFTSGGPRQLDMLYDRETIRGDFPGVEWDVLEETEVHLDEGPLHQGRASLLRGLGRKTG
jgi:hypothetical protein